MEQRAFRGGMMDKKIELLVDRMVEVRDCSARYADSSEAANDLHFLGGMVECQRGRFDMYFNKLWARYVGEEVAQDEWGV